MKIIIDKKEYDFTEQELEYLKSKLTSKKIEYKEIGVVDVAVYLGEMLIGYINVELMKQILKELKKIGDK